MKKQNTKFTESLIRKLAPRGRADIVQAMSALLNEMLPRFGITTPKRIAPFLANILVETGGFRALEENMNYSAKRMTQIWPRRFPSLAHAVPYARNPQKLAHKVYGGRGGNQGKPGAGWKYRGSGFMQTTFYQNYLQVERLTGLPVTKNPDLLRRPREGLEAACIYWQENGCNELADAGKLKQIRRRINGGYHGLQDMQWYYRKALPLVKDLDLKSSVTKASSLAGLTAISTPATGDLWIGLAILAVAVVGIAIFIGYKLHRSKKDVQEGLAETQELEDILVEPGFYLGDGDDLDRSGYHELLDDDGS